MVTGIREKVDVCVVGAGHAGCEAALACADWDLRRWFLRSVWTVLR